MDSSGTLSQPRATLIEPYRTTEALGLEAFQAAPILPVSVCLCGAVGADRSNIPGISHGETGITQGECTMLQEGPDGGRYIGSKSGISNIDRGTTMRKQFAVLVLAAGMWVGLANSVSGAATSAPQDEKMQSQDKMKDEKMKDGKMTGDKMASQKMKGEKMKNDNMSGDKMKDEKVKKDKMEDKQ